MRLYLRLNRRVEPPLSKPTRSRRLLGAIALLGAAALALALVLLFGPRKPKTADTRATIGADAIPESDTANTPARPTAPIGSNAARTLPSRAREGPDEDRRPHPITPEHVRIQNENQMLGALNDATDVKDVARLRQLVEVWKSKHDADPEKYAEAYTVIADCLELRNDESRAKARRFYDENRWSTLRRHIRRHCF